MRTKKRILPVLMAAIIAITGFGIAGTNQAAAGTKNFTDLPSNHWAYSSIQKMQEKGIIKGYPDGKFKPSDTVTYGEFIKMAVVALNGKDDITNAPDATHWASGYYKAAMEEGLFNSKQISERQLGREIPRADMALISANAIKAGAVDGYAELIESLPDVDKTTVNEYQIVQAYGSGLITGYEDGTFRPDGVLTRAEASTVIYRIIDKSARKIPEGVNVGKNTEEPKEDAKEEADAEWHTDKHGTYRFVNLADYLSKESMEEYKEDYYFPEKAKLYKTKLEATSKPYAVGAGTVFIFKEDCMTLLAIKDKKAYGKNQGIERNGMSSGTETSVTVDGTDFDIKTFDYIMAVHMNLEEGRNWTAADIDYCTPGIYENPFK